MHTSAWTVSNPAMSPMTEMSNPEPSLEESEYAVEERRTDVFLPEDEAGPDEFPRLRNISAAFFYKAIARPVAPEPPTYVTLTELTRASMEMAGAVGLWNMLWEAAQYRRRFFDLDELPPQMSRIADLGDVNVVFVPRTPSRYHEYAPLIHLLPQQTLARFGLPLLRGGQWPFMADYAGIDEFLPTDFPRPACTCVGVDGVAAPGLRVRALGVLR